MFPVYPHSPQGAVQLDSRVEEVVQLINTSQIIPYGDYGGNNLYWFQTVNNGIGNIIYTTFDRETHLGLASFTVRYGAATTIRQVISGNFPRSLIDLQHLILPRLPSAAPPQGSVIPG